MAKSPNHNRPEKQCDGKTKHKTILSVEYYLENKSSNIYQDYYKCTVCHNYHIGSSGKLKYKGKINKRNIDKDGMAFNKRIIRKFKY